MDAKELSMSGAARCVQCGVLRVSGEDGLCLHCRMRLALSAGLRDADERYAATWVACAVLSAALLLLVLVGGGEPPSMVLALRGG